MAEIQHDAIEWRWRGRISMEAAARITVMAECDSEKAGFFRRKKKGLDRMTQLRPKWV